MTELKNHQSLTEADHHKWMDIKEFRESGYLQELNRLFLHPLGLALATVRKTEDGDEHLLGILDYRDSPEGIVFKDQTLGMVEHALAIGREQRQRFANRKKALGYVVQPLSVTIGDPPDQS